MYGTTTGDVVRYDAPPDVAPITWFPRSGPRKRLNLLANLQVARRTVAAVTAARRWWIVAVGVLLLVATPALVRAFPVPDDARGRDDAA